MKNAELKAKIKASSAKGLKKPEMFALLHEVLSPEALERFSGYVRFLEDKFGTTDLIYRYTGGVGASVRFYIRANAGNGATAISFDVKNDTWVIPANLPSVERKVSHDVLRAQENLETLNRWLAQFTHAAGRLEEVKQVLARAIEKSEGADDFTCGAHYPEKKITIKLNNGKLPVLVTFNLNQRKQIAAGVAEHAVISWETKPSDHDDQLENIRALADQDFKARILRWKEEDEAIVASSKRRFKDNDYHEPSVDVVRLLVPFTPLDPSVLLSYIKNQSTQSAGRAISDTFDQMRNTVTRNGELKDVAMVVPDKNPWVVVALGSHQAVAYIHLFFDNDIIVDHRVAIARPRRMLEEFFCPSQPTLGNLNNNEVRSALVFACRDDNTYQKAVAWLDRMKEAGLAAFSLSYAADENGEAVVTLGPDFTQYERTDEPGLSFVYDGRLKVIEEDLTEEPASPETGMGNSILRATGSLGKERHSPWPLPPHLATLVDRVIDLKEFRNFLDSTLTLVEGGKAKILSHVFTKLRQEPKIDEVKAIIRNIGGGILEMSVIRDGEDEFLMALHVSESGWLSGPNPLYQTTQKRVEDPVESVPFNLAGLAAIHGRPATIGGINTDIFNRSIPLKVLHSMIPVVSKPGAAGDILAALSGRVGKREYVSLHLVDPRVLEIRCLDIHNQPTVALRVSVDQNTMELIEPIRPYGLPLSEPLGEAVEHLTGFQHSMSRHDAINYVKGFSLTDEHAKAILDALEHRAPEADGFMFKWDEAIGRVIVSALYGSLHDNKSTRIATVGLVGQHMADVDQSSAHLDALLRKRSERPSRFSDRPSPETEAAAHMPSPDQDHVREVMEAPNPEVFVFPRETQASIDKADADTALNFLKLITSGMPQWKILQAMQFVATVANNIHCEEPLLFRVVANQTIFIQYGTMVEDSMTSISSIKIPRD